MDTGGINAIKPKKREANQKAEQVEAWLNEEYPAIHRKAKAENAEIFWGDETAVQEATIQKFRAKEHFNFDNLNTLCRLLNCQPGDIIEYIPDTHTQDK